MSTLARFYSQDLQNIHQEASAENIIDLLLADKRSPQTRRAYSIDLKDFFTTFNGGAAPSPAAVQMFLSLPTPKIAESLAFYKSNLRDRGMAEASINRRLAAVKSLLKFGYRLGMCATDGRSLIDGERVQSYRDTRGIDLAHMKQLVAAPLQKHGPTPIALRDTAILLLLCENALRRAEVCKLNEEDLDERESTLRVFGKGKGTQSLKVTVSTVFIVAVKRYLETKQSTSKYPFESTFEKPLFLNFSRNSGQGNKRLTADGLYKIVGQYGELLGVADLTPHKLRHSAITAALDATGGDVRKVAKLSRHAKIETLLIYDDNRKNVQSEMTGLLSDLLSK
jgi:integrase/recombinase XerC